MSELMETVCASAPAGIVRIATLELIHPEFENGGHIYLCVGFDNITATLETGEVVEFIACGMDVALPAKNATGRQDLGFAIDNVLGRAYRNIRAALETSQPMELIHRTYLSTNLTELYEPPNRATITEGEMSGGTLNINASYFDLINYLFCRDTYDLNRFPGLAYI